MTKTRILSYMHHMITIILKCVHRKHIGEICFKLLAVLSHYEIVDDIYFCSLLVSMFSKFSIISSYIFYNYGIIEKKMKKRTERRSWDLLHLLFLCNQEACGVNY